MQLSSYKATYEDGKLVLPKEAGEGIPKNAEILITVLGETPEEVIRAREEAYKERIRKTAIEFLDGVREIRKNLTEEDHAAIDELQSGKYKVRFEERLA
ncbi:MAG: hypothetical protein LBE35_03830 [Clostridiales bacterium]|jgi:hypothetical protein|nr:hypothetical protein [Clostridiales bacterium]